MQALPLLVAKAQQLAGALSEGTKASATSAKRHVQKEQCTLPISLQLHKLSLELVGCKTAGTIAFAALQITGSVRSAAAQRMQ